MAHQSSELVSIDNVPEVDRLLKVPRWDRAMIGIRQTSVHSVIQDRAKTLLSRSRVEVPQLALDVLAEWLKQTIYARDNDYVFPSVKLSG